MNHPDAACTAVRPSRDPQALACLAGVSASLILMVLILLLA
jgi:hypothetical protein